MTIKPLHWCLALPALLTGWLAVLAGVMALSDEAPAALVLFPSQDFLSALPDDTAILSETPVSITLSSASQGLAPALYRSGAWIVLPAGLLGCFTGNQIEV